MGRRALRKISPSLDLSAYFRELEDLSCPLDLGLLFDRDLPLEVEVGSGKGLFLANAAAGNAEHNWLGVELARKYARFTAARLARQGLPNAAVICGDALAFFRGHLPDRSLAGVHVYFPDPWWKKRHRKRRVMRAEFLRDVQRVLRPAGRLHFWTDVEEYFRESLEIIAEATSLVGPHDVPEAEPEHDLDYRTHFERRTRLSDQPVFRAEFTRDA